MMSLLLHVTCSCIFHAYVPSFISILILICVGVFLHVSLSLSLSLPLTLVALWHLNGNLLRLETLFVPGLLRLLPPLILLHLTSGSMMIKLVKAFLENFSRRNIHSECQVVLSDFSDTDLPTVIYSRGWESMCDILVTCPSMII